MLIPMTQDVSVYEMLRMISRAKLAAGGYSVEDVTRLLPDELTSEFHRAVVVLAAKGMLSSPEQILVKEYAESWVYSQPLPISRGN